MLTHARSRCALARAHRVLLALALGAVVFVACGCSTRQRIHPALRVQDEDIDRGVGRGKRLIISQADCRDAFAPGIRDANVRVSPHVILRTAGCVWPADEIAFQLCQSGDTSDAGIRRAVQQALKTVEEALRITATVQIPAARDPGTIQFALRTNTGLEYPPLAVEQPIYQRSVASPFDPTAPASAIYYYVIRFPIRGGPGVPPVGPQISILYLVVRDGDAEGTAEFRLPSRSR
jgi:hypothetical protein